MPNTININKKINKFNKTSEQIEQEENEKYLNELKGKL